MNSINTKIYFPYLTSSIMTYMSGAAELLAWDLGTSYQLEQRCQQNFTKVSTTLQDGPSKGLLRADS